jgi:dephospho-CoA kinase
MKVIGLTGGIGSGKTTVAQFLKELGAVVMDLDKTGHDVLKKPGDTYKKVLREFGDAILAPGKEIDRAKLGKLVFGNPEALKKLNGIIHPAIDTTVEKALKEFRRKGVGVVVLEAAAMLEAERKWLADEIWITVAPEPVILERLKTRSGYSAAEAKTRIASQMQNIDRVGQADVIINTDCSMEELQIRVKDEWDRLLQRI